MVQESLNQMRKEFDYSELKRQAEEQLQVLMEILRSDSSSNIGL